MIIQLGIILSVIVVVFMSVFMRPNDPKRRVPQGPLLRLPVVGHLLFLGLQPQKTLLKWSKNYGPMFRIQLGTFETIVINDGKLIRKAFSSSALSGRPRTALYDALSYGRKDLVFSDGSHVGELRQHFRDNFRIFATSTTQPIENRILNEAENLIAKIRKSGNTPLLIRGIFHSNVVNSILDVTMGLRCLEGDKTSERLREQIQELAEMKSIFEFLGLFIPKLCNLAPKLTGLIRREYIMDSLKDTFGGIIKKHSDAFVYGQPRDILDAYLEKGTGNERNNFTFTSEAGHLIPFLFDMLGAGMETTSTQMEWIIYYMVKYPEIQAKIQAEIDTFIGVEREPHLQDRMSLVFTEAVVLEALRIASIAPLGLFHSALEDCEFDGYHIPKGTLLIGNLYAAHHDPAVWGDPNAFRPERFIDLTSGRLKKCEDLVPFSWGKRRCIGEELARQELFLFTVSILQQFRLAAVEKLPPEEGFGFKVAPQPFKVIVHPRI